MRAAPGSPPGWSPLPGPAAAPTAPDEPPVKPPFVMTERELPPSFLSRALRVFA